MDFNMFLMFVSGVLLTIGVIVIYNNLIVVKYPLDPDDLMNGRPVWYSDKCPKCGHREFKSVEGGVVTCGGCEMNFIYTRIPFHVKGKPNSKGIFMSIPASSRNDSDIGDDDESLEGIFNA